MINGDEETKKARAFKKQKDLEIEKVEEEALFEERKKMAKKVAQRKAEYEADKKIKNIGAEGMLGKIFNAADNFSKNAGNFSDNMNKENRKNRKSKKDDFEPFDFTKIKVKY